MEPKVLLASSDELEELAGSLDTAQVQRRSGAFTSGRTVVGYSVDDISGYDLDSGDQLWTAKLDLGGGTVCHVSQPDRAVKTFTVAYGESSYCPNLATIRVSDGKVVTKSDKLTGLVQYKGESAGGTINHLFTVKGQDYLVDLRGVVWKMVKGEPQPFPRLKADSYSTSTRPRRATCSSARGSATGVAAGWTATRSPPSSTSGRRSPRRCSPMCARTASSRRPLETRPGSVRRPRRSTTWSRSIPRAARCSAGPMLRRTPAAGRQG